ncbi:MAG: tripartite tricarboxylate transporter substrate binding protein [Burkholderiales bacterium]|nr:tripartite tricarboxylate transporter substrate binding protein [Burkholderiales bacterium]
MIRNESAARVIALAIVALALTPAAQAQSWPSKSIRMIVPFPAGGGVDYIGRLVGNSLSSRLGQQVVIDNRAGANGILGLQVLVASPADGYTIAAASGGPLVINPHIYRKIPYDTLRDLTPIANMSGYPYVLVVHPSLPVKSVKELIALARARPGEIAYSSPGVGNGQHLGTALFVHAAKIKVLHIPYKGNAPSVVALVSGEAQFTFSSIPGMLPHIRSGRARALGVGTAQRIPSLPDVPTVAEAGLPGFEVYGWAGMVGPAHMPRDVVQRLNKEIVETLRQKDVIERMIGDGTLPIPSSPEEFAAYMKSELKKWGEVVKLAGIKPE